MFRGAVFILHISCVSGTEVQVAVHKKEDIPYWLEKLDHEGSCVAIFQHVTAPDGEITATNDITQEFLAG